MTRHASPTSSPRANGGSQYASDQCAGASRILVRDAEELTPATLRRRLPPPPCGRIQCVRTTPSMSPIGRGSLRPFRQDMGKITARLSLVSPTRLVMAALVRAPRSVSITLPSSEALNAIPEPETKLSHRPPTPPGSRLEKSNTGPELAQKRRSRAVLTRRAETLFVCERRRSRRARRRDPRGASGAIKLCDGSRDGAVTA